MAVKKFDPNAFGIVIFGTLSGKEGIRRRVKMVLDTGATYTMIPWYIAEELGYNPAASKEFVSMTESLDTSTAMGRFVMDIIQRIAQLESEQIGERVYIGMEQKARTNGGVLGFNIPYGYDYIKGKLEINKEESMIVREIYSWYYQGQSMGEIAKMLNSTKIPTKKGGLWAKKTISMILKNPTYCGYLHWEDYINKSDHEKIIDKNDFDEIQNLIAKRGGSPAKKLAK